MGLKKYKQKRNLGQTPEPSGGRPSGSQLRFVVHKHDASRLHYDLRLEMEGVLKSWAVPKGPSLNPADKRLAMMVEDHPYDYKDFEGVIPKGQYGAGPVIIWDEGNYTARQETENSERALLDGLQNGHITFVLNGQKLKGEFALVKMEDAEENARSTGSGQAWLLIKKDDEFASKEDITKQDQSVKSGRTIADLRQKAEINTELLELDGVPKGAMPRAISPMLATLIDEPFDDPGWLYEIKWDGYRAIAEIDNGKVNFYSRNQKPYNTRYAVIVNELKKIKHRAVIDGEVVVLDENGRPDFQLLQDYEQTGGKLAYMVFDLLYLNGHDLTGQPLIRRKHWLKQILPKPAVISYSDHVDRDGRAFFREAEKMNLEGMIAKAADSKYLPGRRSGQWQKIKTHKRQEAVIGGFTRPRGGRKNFGALVLGVYEGDDLVYIGHSGGGFSEAALRELHRRLLDITRQTSPFKEKPLTNEPATWVEPKLVCEVKFTEWTKDGHMRHPIFMGLREDKDAKKVVRELPQKVKSDKRK